MLFMTLCLFVLYHPAQKQQDLPLIAFEFCFKAEHEKKQKRVRELITNQREELFKRLSRLRGCLKSCS